MLIIIINHQPPNTAFDQSLKICNKMLFSCQSGLKINSYLEKDRSMSTEDTGSVMYSLSRAASFGKWLSTAHQNATMSLELPDLWQYPCRSATHRLPL